METKKNADYYLLKFSWMGLLNLGGSMNIEYGWLVMLVCFGLKLLRKFSYSKVDRYIVKSRC